jgi:hypothetical protein
MLRITLCKASVQEWLRYVQLHLQTTMLCNVDVKGAGSQYRITFF